MLVHLSCLSVFLVYLTVLFCSHRLHNWHKEYIHTYITDINITIQRKGNYLSEKVRKHSFDIGLSHHNG